jgi:hypothetical protein
VLVWSHWDNRHLGYYDRRAGKEGWWVIETEKLDAGALLQQTGDVIMPVLRGTAKKVSSARNVFAVWTTISSSSGTILQYAGPSKVRRIRFAEGTDEVLPGSFPGLTNRSINLSLDGKEIVYVAPRLSARLILVENLFK